MLGKVGYSVFSYCHKIWFIAGYFVFVPLFITAIFLVKREEKNIDFHGLLYRLRIKKLTKSDWYLAIVGALSSIVSGVAFIGFAEIINLLQQNVNNTESNIVQNKDAAVDRDELPEL